MTKRTIRRRTFLKRAALSFAASPVFASLASAGITQERKPDVISPQNAKSEVAKAGVILNVRDFGAAGDGKTKDTVAIQQTIDRCAVFGGGEVVAPAGDYLTGALQLRSNVVLRIEEGASLLGSPDMADYPLAQVRWEGRWITGYIGFISATEADNFGIVGPGKIIGSPAVVGRVDRKTKYRLPALLEFTSCKNVSVENCFTQNYGMWSIHPTYCENISFKNVTVKSGADGIDVDSCRHVVIDGCDFDTRDDCISLKSGRGEEGFMIARPTEDVRISNCTFADVRWACIGIGSETSGGIRDVHVEHCKFVAANTFSIYIKSRPGRGAFIEDIYMNDLDVSGAKQGFLRFNIFNSGLQDEFPVPGDAGIPTTHNFRFTNIRVKDVPVLVDGGSIHPHKPLDGFTLANVTGTCGKGITLANINHVELRNIKVTGFSGPLLSIHNVTGTGLSGATQIDALKLPEPIIAPEKPYDLH